MAQADLDLPALRGDQLVRRLFSLLLAAHLIAAPDARIVHWLDNETTILIPPDETARQGVEPSQPVVVTCILGSNS